MAVRYEIHIDAGADLFVSVEWKNSAGAPIDLTGYTARWAFKRAFTDTTYLAYMTTATGEGITITPATGKFALHIPNAITAGFADTVSDEGVHDLEAVSPTGIVTRLLEGPWFSYPEVTKESV